MTIERQANRVRKVKKFESGIVSEPVTPFYSRLTLAELAELVNKNGYLNLPVVDSENNPIRYHHWA